MSISYICDFLYLLQLKLVVDKGTKTEEIFMGMVVRLRCNEL